MPRIVGLPLISEQNIDDAVDVLEAEGVKFTDLQGSSASNEAKCWALPGHLRYTGRAPALPAAREMARIILRRARRIRLANKYGIPCTEWPLGR